ncbi:MAG: translation initiation factor IF-1 [Candidatus Nealsonbacteria bacterium CG_4_9_14_0_2_um_filter_37_38]|uniref:Translation initiation factor IF-1 n=1 Tax=Candidatus Nealsonbacteria bacterium CG_4_10_14_0_8_um_filter_37_14 TaxID=1974684 RepID=A0A2M7R757_9BACT|nr:MAG: translation initiation factor IF-1 [Candidatus Nealsonbacteria bacterium CG11_big_fil_rev_8_21_14_0_20_37_68]PIW92081.1 MAG: translation initiation factor IF-1 [Candidatus Nealsonbacteria bacterium CG_4_8_14_3_um_filter_37_23]PIY89674.1 MAG: translation initiation factor IF-1 [Candidatus Nealsonbacteria bacterium CG_4_10_14_0_8_um_filter_37_14]PJC51860.1 MAG: translation initiation factor IF-1 [Candidatus Nealsonbacteria bacterium CG_4_9_14_0_2_um_filter_37_38]
MDSNKNKKTFRKTGQVLEALRGNLFKVRLDDGGEILAHLSGKLRMYRIKVLPGDQVTVEMTPYDDKKGRIVYRGK